MARRPRPRQRGNSYDKRPSSALAPLDLPSADGLSSADAHALAEQIRTEQTRWRVQSIRLIEGGVCCLVLLDSTNATEHQVRDNQEWQRLRAL